MSILRNSHIRTFLKLVAANALPEELFEPQIDINRSKELFKFYVKHFEIEHHSYCNRTCWFCPNSSVDRQSTNIKIDKKLLLKMFNELAEINYDQSLVWSGYGEPLADETILDDIRLAKNMLPNAYHRLYTNGDYLTGAFIRRLEKSGLDLLRVSLYPKVDYESEKTELLQNLSKRTGLRIIAKSKEYDGLQLEGSSLLIIVEVKNFKPQHMSSRGSYLKKESGEDQYIRTLPCFSPIMHMSVAYDGNCMLCCQVRPDVKDHQSAIIGNLSNEKYSIFHYYRDLSLSRSALLRPGIKTGVCKSCSVNPFGGGPYKLGRMKVVAKVLNAIPGSIAFMNSFWLYPRKDRNRYKRCGDL